MMMSKKFYIILVIIFVGIDAMTRPQLKNSLKMFKKSCMAKNNVTEDQVGTIDEGKFIEERNVMCYIACIYRMIQIVKKDRLVYEASLRQIDIMYPADIKKNAKDSVDACIEFTAILDICEACFYTARCMYAYDPKCFMFA